MILVDISLAVLMCNEFALFLLTLELALLCVMYKCRTLHLMYRKINTNAKTVKKRFDMG